MSRSNVIRSALPAIIFLLVIAAVVYFVSRWGNMMANFPVPDDAPPQNAAPHSPDVYKGAFEPKEQEP
jgi:hypothetical protein